MKPSGIRDILGAAAVDGPAPAPVQYRGGAPMRKAPG